METGIDAGRYINGNWYKTALPHNVWIGEAYSSNLTMLILNFFRAIHNPIGVKVKTVEGEENYSINCAFKPREHRRGRFNLNYSAWCDNL